MPTIAVEIRVAAALVDADRRILLVQAKNLWAFPGGAVADGEMPEVALIRALKEELTIELTEACLAPLGFASDKGLLLLYACRKWDGQIALRQKTRWELPRDMFALEMPPPDKSLVAMLRDFL